MEKTTRLRINLSAKEIEWEGSEEFIKKYDLVIQEFIEFLKSSPQVNSTKAKNNGDSNSSHRANTSSLPDNFGEYYIQFQRSSLSVTDKILLAAYFVQSKSSDSLFTATEAASILKEQAVQITNANAFIKSLQKAGKLFKSGGKYKVSEKGIEAIGEMPR